MSPAEWAFLGVSLTSGALLAGLLIFTHVYYDTTVRREDGVTYVQSRPRRKRYDRFVNTVLGLHIPEILWYGFVGCGVFWVIARVLDSFVS